ncbi:MAG TPA: alpha/beta hydrolase-fold protein [Chitinophagaceae bacterium]
MIPDANHYRSVFFYGMIFLMTFFLQKNLSAQSFPEAKIPGSEIRKLNSPEINQEYELQISLPGGYSNSNKKYPVVYLMDSQWDFPLVTALYGQQYYDGFIPEMIIVGITWGGSRPNPDSLRARDYTPTNDKRLPQSGGADKFLSFIKNEVFPFIESNYKADKNDRTLMGCSLGGLFTMYTLFTQPQMFNRYVAASPAYSWDNVILYQYEKKYFENKLNPQAKLFMCVGGVEKSVPGFEQLTKFLNDRHYSSLQIESRVLENTGHSGTKGEGFARGLQFVFQRPSLKLSSSILDQYAGKYVIDDKDFINLKVEDGMLVSYSNNGKDVLQAASETDFYLASSFLNVHFKKDDNGNVTGFQLDRYGSSQFVKKIAE